MERDLTFSNVSIDQRYLWSQMQNDESSSLTPDQLWKEKILPVGRSGIYRGLHDGTIPSIRVGKKFVIPRAAIKRWLEDAGKA